MLVFFIVFTLFLISDTKIQQKNETTKFFYKFFEKNYNFVNLPIARSS